MTLLALARAGAGLLDPEAPVLHADDEAILRGRAAFETVRVYGGRPFRLDDHLDRLVASSERIGLAPVDPAEITRAAEEAVGAAGAQDAVLRLLWTAGRTGDDPVGLALVTEIAEDWDAVRARGIRAISLLGVRAEVPWLLGGVKSTSYAVNMAAEAEARRRGADDAIFVDRDGTVLEGPVTNVWWRLGAVLYTPSLALGVLAGVTRATLLEAAPGLGYGVEEGAFPLSDLAGAEEAFSSSSVREILPVVELDGRAVAGGRPGRAATELQLALRRAAGAV